MRHHRSDLQSPVGRPCDSLEVGDAAETDHVLGLYDSVFDPQRERNATRYEVCARLVFRQQAARLFHGGGLVIGGLRHCAPSDRKAAAAARVLSMIL